MTLKEWEGSCTKTEIPTAKQILGFIERKAEILESYQAERPPVHSSPLKERRSTHVSVSKELKCPLCKAKHRIFACEKFVGMEIHQRKDAVRANRLCFNCLRAGHRVSECTSSPCKTCKEKHNSLLHSNRQREPQVQPAALQCIRRDGQTSPTVLLATALVDVIDVYGNRVTGRALVDNGSQSNFIREGFAKHLGLKGNNAHHIITGIGGDIAGPLRGITCQVRSRIDNYSTKLDCLILPSITHQLPSSTFSISGWNIPENLLMADPRFNIKAPIDMLIGAGEAFHVASGRNVRLARGLPVLSQTRFGWVVGGTMAGVRTNQDSSVVCGCSIHLEQAVQKFWEIESFNERRELTLEEKECEELFVTTTTRESDGRFRVQLPRKTNFSSLGESRDTASRRFLKLEKRLERLPQLKEAYSGFIREYASMGHMEIAPEADGGYYLPHHCVINEDSNTTKLRVVFDASCKTTSGISLNDVLKVGPTIQQDLLSIIMRVREHRFVVTGDISKMYRQILVSEDDAKFQKIIWRNHADEKLKTYALLTVTYGTAPASFLATRCLKQLAIENSNEFPKAAKIIQRDFSVDDLLTGADSIEELRDIVKQIVAILKQGCFPLHKWCTNCPNIFTGHTHVAQEVSFSPKQDNDPAVKTLGLWWDPVEDTLKYRIKLRQYDFPSKRMILSEIASLFDPLGLVGPVVTMAKIFIQKMWEIKIDWDEPLSSDLQQEWRRFRNQLPELANIRIPRLAITDHKGVLEIHGFCDASERAYGAAIYIRTSSNDRSAKVRLLCSKSRVAPVKKITLPRLELCAALLLARLVVKVRASLVKAYGRVILWSDSTVALAWIKSPSNRWKTFISNRVAEIQELTAGCSWLHVASGDNAADILSRGCRPEDIIPCSNWWEGPAWLSRSEKDWPQQQPLPVEVPESRVCLLTNTYVSVLDFTRFSSFHRLVRTIAYVKRFIYNTRRRSARRHGELNNEEYYAALAFIVGIVQREAFPLELKCLAESREIPKGSQLRSLNPFLDQNGVIRVGGRLSKSNALDEEKHQIVLPSKHRVTILLAELEHRRNHHAGPQLLLATIRQRFWPLSGRNLVRKIVHKCVRCYKCKPTATFPMMGDLPLERIESTRAFLNTGVDYCGPINVKSGHSRGSKIHKAYISIFICLATKAVHFEVVSDLTSNCFLAAFQRFIARRGKPAKMFSDNGKNFVGAQKKLNQNFQLMVSDASLQGLLCLENISWTFIPPRAPNFGGLWEAAVKSFKYHFKRVVGDAHLTFEELVTVVTSVEACLNSRPLTPLSSDPNDPNTLTPGHFLVGGALSSVPEPDLTTTPMNRLKRWQRVQRIYQHFWDRWRKEYIPSLQPRQKWTERSRNLLPGQLVLVQEDHLPPMSWLLGRIIEVHPGSDGIVRVCTIRSPSGSTFKRPASKLYALPFQDDD